MHAPTGMKHTNSQLGTQEIGMALKNRFFAPLSALFVLVFMLIAAGCAEQVGDIDRTEPNKIRKSQFAGVWYMVRTVTDVPYGVAFSFEGEMAFGSNPKVVFDIQEKFLVVYPVTELLEGAEKGFHAKKIRKYWDAAAQADGDPSNDFVELYVGQPVAAFKIVKHFDLKRKYNAQTGEQSNVFEENDVDRGWFERDYIRVDWSVNEVTDFGFVAGKVPLTGVPYYVQEVEDGLNPDRPEFEDGYISFVLKLLASPESSGSCSVYTLAPGDCLGGVIKARYSFKLANPLPTYNPKRWFDLSEQDKFGYFVSDRYAYDENTGITYAGKDTKINRWNIWRQVWDFVDLPEQKACTTHDDCNTKAQEFCFQDAWFAGGVCKKKVLRRPGDRYNFPTADRTEAQPGMGIKPIIYHVSANFPEYLIDESYEMAEGWDNAFKETASWMLFWDEKGDETGGMFLPRSCTVDADCAEGVATLQVQVEPAGRGRTVIAYETDGGLGTLITYDGQYPPSSQFSGKALVRYVNAQPGSGPVEFRAGADVLASGVGFDPNNHYESYGVLDAGVITVDVLDGGNAVAQRTNVKVEAGHIYLLVYSAGTLVNVHSSLSSGTGGVTGDQGVRVVNLLKGRGPQNMVLNGARRAGSVKFGEASDFVAPGYNGRHTVSLMDEAGRQDVTCFHDEFDLGRCVGSKPKLTQADYDRRLEIKNKLPDIFVLCRNQFTGLLCDGRSGDKNDKADCRYTWESGGTAHNPCRDDVANPHALKKIGDARYNLVNYVLEAQSAAPLGYGPSAADPDTGEIYFGAANIYGASLTTYGRYAQDLTDLVNGDLNVSDMITGRYVRQYLKGQVTDPPDGFGTFQAGLSVDGAAASGVAARAHVSQAQSAALALVRSQPIAPATSMKPWERPELFQYILDPDYRKQLARQYLEGLPTADQLQARFNRIAGTPFERMLVSNEVKVALSGGRLQPGDPITAEDLEMLKPQAWGNKAALEAESRRMGRLTNASNNTCVFLASFVDDAIFGLAKALKDQGYAGEALRIQIEKRIYGGVLEHEVGHTVGLRHNFGASNDLFNYKDEYFSIRERERVPCRADSWCEVSGAEKCEFINCTTAADCGAGLSCGSGNQCVDAAGILTGFCFAQVDYQVPCESGCPSGTVCDQASGQCAMERSCSQTSDCLEGEACDGGTCAVGGKVVREIYTTTVTEPVKKFLPRPYMTDREVVGRRTEYQYSSVMDYGGRINSDIHGLGKYDVAAIKAGYGDLLETYRDTSRFRSYIKANADFNNTPENVFAFILDTSWYRYAGATGSPFNNLENYIGVQENLQRDTVPWDQVKYEHLMVDNFNRSNLDFTYVEVPYRACYDEYRGNLGCYYFDTGVDLGEMIFHAMNSLEEYYVLDAFKRERYGFGRYGSAFSYFGRILDRYLRPIGHGGQYYSLYFHFFKDFSWFQNWRNAPYEGRTLRLASETAFQYLTDLLASPAPGSYRFNTETQRFENISFESGAAGSELDIPLGPGKFPYTQFQSRGGYYDFEHAVWIGSFWEKLASLVTLTDSTAYFTTDFIAELGIRGGTSIGFNTLYQTELINVLGGIISDDLPMYAGVAEGDGYRSRPVIGPNLSAQQATMPVVEPSIHDFTFKLYSAIYGLAYLPAGFDPVFIDSMAVVYDGNGSQYDLNPEVQKITFTDPFGNKVYAAWTNQYVFKDTQYGGEKRPLEVGYRMLEKANELKARWEATTGPEKMRIERTLKDLIIVLDTLRGLNDIYGTWTY